MSEIEPRLKALMLRGLGGDAMAHGELLRAMSGYLRGYFARHLGAGAADVEDLVQEVLLTIHVKRDTYDSAQLFTPWAYALARYKLLDHFRRARKYPTVPIEDVENLFADQNPEEGAVRRDLDKLLSTLPGGQRALMEGVKLQGLTMDEAGARSGMSAAAARVSIHRGLRALIMKVRDENR